MEKLELPMVGLPSLRELSLSVDESITVHNDDFIVNRTVPNLVLRTARGFRCALSDGRLDHLTSLRVEATANQLAEIVLSAARSKRLCTNLKSLHCLLREWTGDGEVMEEILSDDAVPDLVKLCPNLQELIAFGVLAKLRLHPENKGLDKLILCNICIPWKPFEWLKNLVARNTSVELIDIHFRDYLGW